MNVLFEVERFNDPAIDSKLLDVLFSIKQSVLEKLAPLAKEIDECNGEIVIVFTPTISGFRALFMQLDLMERVATITDKIIFLNIVERIVNANMN